MNYLINPATGEKPINGWIIFLIILAALALIATLLAPKFPKIKEFLNKIIKK